MKKIIKTIFVLMLSFSFSNASLVEDGYIELEKGNVLEAANIFKISCEKGAFAGCYNLGLMYFKGELEMTEGALYPLLHKLENEGVIYSEMQQVNGRDRKYYLLTEKGKKQQALQEEEMKSYLFNLNAIFNI
jgi:TPR repeat protein